VSVKLFNLASTSSYDASHEHNIQTFHPSTILLQRLNPNPNSLFSTAVPMLDYSKIRIKLKYTNNTQLKVFTTKKF